MRNRIGCPPVPVAETHCMKRAADSGAPERIDPGHANDRIPIEYKGGEKMKKMVKAASLVATAAMAASLAACGGSSAQTTTAAATTAAAAESKAEESKADTAESKADGAVDLSGVDANYKLELKLSHVFAPDEALTKNMQAIADSIKDKSNGMVDIQCFPQSQLPVYQDGVAQVVAGANFISVEDPSYLGDYVADFNVLAGPMLVTSYDQFGALLETDEVKDMFKKAEEKGIKILNMDYIFGFRSMMTNKEIKTPDDLKGMKIRTPKSELYVNTLNAMGATATPMGFADTIAAVQQGVVDGLEGTIDAYGSNGSAEVAKKMALTKHLLGVCGAYINPNVFNGMPEPLQKLVQDEFDAGAKNMVKQVSENEEAQKKNLTEKYGIEFNDVDVDAFKATLAPIYKEMETKKGTTPGLYDKFQEYIKDVK
ncbi:MAG: C4-dicarboxylate TRAP transporter substrate-binding protein [Bacillota bacterium]|nr:C4-dicarboxylate TRAP transporter substrate-binding protein [Bacillota bacterium]